MFSKTATLAFVLAAVVSTVASAQATSTKIVTKSSKSEAKASASVSANKKASAKAAKAPASTKGESVTIVQLNNLNLNANASATSQVLHPVAGRSIFQAAPKSNNLVLETKLDKTPATSNTIRTNAVGIEYARGLSNDLALNISTDIGSNTVKPKKGQETTNTGMSDINVQIGKMYQQDMQQSFVAGYMTSGLGAATRGNFTADNKNIDGNRFSGGMTLGGAFAKQTSALAGNYGYKLAAALQFNRKIDIQQSSPIYSATEITGGHMLGAEAFGEKMIGQASKIGGAIGLNVILPTESSTRIGTTAASASTGQLNIMSLKAFAALSAGQLEFIPTAIFQKNLGTSGGESSIESSENVGVELTTRFSL